MNFPRISGIWLLLGPAIFAAGCGAKGDDNASKEQAVPVTLQPVQTRSVQRTVEIVGTLWGQEEATISAKVPGKVAVIYKDVGDLVDPGAPLIEVKKHDYELACDQKKSAIEEALAKIGLSDFPKADFDPSQVPTVVRSHLQYENAKSRCERGRQLHDQTPPLMSDQDYSDLQTVLSVAKSNYDVELMSVNATLAEARSKASDYAVAKQRLDDTTFRAPVAPVGETTDFPLHYRVASRMVSVGELVTELTPLMHLVADDQIKLRATVTERYIGDVVNGQTVLLHIDAYPDQAFTGKITRISPQVDAVNRTFQVEALFPNTEHKLKSGAFAKASIQVRTDKDVLYVPQGSLVSYAGVTKVFMIDKDSRAWEVEVNIGDPDPAADTAKGPSPVEVLKGDKGPVLKPGDCLVVSGASKMAKGVLVTVLTSTTQPATNP